MGPGLASAEQAAGGISHNALLPSALVERVPHSEKLVLGFIISYLEAARLPAQLLVNGGYVRDLLLGEKPDDLDLSLCLRDCAEDVTIGTVTEGLKTFAAERPDLAITAVQVTTILSDTSKDKNVDTAKAHMSVGPSGERIEVDRRHLPPPTLSRPIPPRPPARPPAGPVPAASETPALASPRLTSCPQLARRPTTTSTACRVATCAARPSRTLCAAT